MLSMDHLLHNGVGMASVPHSQINLASTEGRSQLHGRVNMHTQRSSGARKRTTTLEKECTSPFKRKACDQGYAAEMPAYFMDFMAQMLNFQKDVCKTLEVVDKIDRMEAVISRKIDSMEERLNAKLEQLVQSEVGHLRDEINNDISHLREQLKGVEAKQEIQKNNHERNLVIKNLPENHGEDLGSAVNGLFIDGLQLQEVSILKT